MMTIEEMRDKVEIAYQSLLSMRGHFGAPEVEPDTVFTIGLALGKLAHARDMIKRDLEAAKANVQ